MKSSSLVCPFPSDLPLSSVKFYFVRTLLHRHSPPVHLCARRTIKGSWSLNTFTVGGGTGVEGAERAVAGAASDDGVGIVQGAGSVSDVGVIARYALAIAPLDVNVSSIKLAGAVSRMKAAVAV